MFLKVLNEVKNNFDYWLNDLLAGIGS